MEYKGDLLFSQGLWFSPTFLSPSPLTRKRKSLGLKEKRPVLLTLIK